jgi:pimeloyl-ACP methyl ester carboxylesterase
MIPDAIDQAESSATTMFEVEVPALQAWKFDSDIARAISQPVLSLMGTAPRTGLGPAEIRRRLHEWLPQMEEFDVPGASHLLQYQSPEHAALVAEGIAAFLARHPILRE